jgi:hypothetical protein
MRQWLDGRGPAPASALLLRLVERLGGWLHLMAAPAAFVDDVLEIMAAESQHEQDMAKRAEAQRKRGRSSVGHRPTGETCSTLRSVSARRFE